jgi:hypothetical protein
MDCSGLVASFGFRACGSGFSVGVVHEVGEVADCACA